jgi:pyruvate dehydrogenase E1 component alpha subunit
VSTVARFEIHHTAFLDPEGKPLRELPAGYTDHETLIDLYRAMVRARLFDEKAIALQRTGQLGTYPSLLGQEAVGVAIAHAMRPDDVLVPSFREHAAQLERGVHPEELFLYWGGDERGSDFSGPREDFPVSATVGGHAPHAAGVGLAFKLRSEARVAVCVFGDGATSKGDAYEAMNAAGLWELPVVFVITNNQWAISTPRAEQTAAETLAQKAIAAGLEGVQVDGNDVIAVASVLSEAVERARTGSPSVVECLTYRLGDHTTVDDASRYREDAEVQDWWQKEPIARLRHYLAATTGWDDVRQEALEAECREWLDKAVDAYLNTPPQPPEAIFDYLYESLPGPLEVQRAALAKRGSGD